MTSLPSPTGIKRETFSYVATSTMSASTKMDNFKNEDADDNSEFSPPAAPLPYNAILRLCHDSLTLIENEAVSRLNNDGEVARNSNEHSLNSLKTNSKPKLLYPGVFQNRVYNFQVSQNQMLRQGKSRGLGPRGNFSIFSHFDESISSLIKSPTLISDCMQGTWSLYLDPRTNVIVQHGKIK